MATSEERIKVLKMVEEGKLTPEAAAKLLNALTESARAKAANANSKPSASSAASVRSQGRSAGSSMAAEQMAEAAVTQMIMTESDKSRLRKLRIRVNSDRDGKARKQVDITVPLTAAGFVARLIDKFVPKNDRGGVDMSEVMDAVRNGATGKIVDIVSADGDTVEISIE
jgi:polyhydroxyalkanoate synthesis regulator phasin